MLGGGQPLLSLNLGQIGPIASETPVFDLYPGGGAQKRKTAFFSSKIALQLKKVCYKVSL